MENLVTVIVILAVIALGALVIHRANTQNSNRISALRYDRYGHAQPGTGGPSHSVMYRPERHHHRLLEWFHARRRAARGRDRHT
ncbi:hypothetical protein LRS74_10705 [Streptomyces sp. LX-29]|uniref:hypothetical protein n=1 Tax=Streptomyces sp. LX-29 TaxID=2900152 RepID=UPI00240E32AC|nr:hypothetical protein [Streptomyces sp. LX-29]WFB07472.1 hypothetical protein LRS74_10705 [Streptomyces sp. LX-29]